jgi:hypothetical protein
MKDSCHGRIRPCPDRRHYCRPACHDGSGCGCLGRLSGSPSSGGNLAGLARLALGCRNCDGLCPCRTRDRSTAVNAEPQGTGSVRDPRSDRRSRGGGLRYAWWSNPRRTRPGGCRRGGGTLGGAAVRASLAASFRRDLPAALIEDAVAIAGAALVILVLR